ncbi:phosphotransferase [Pseudomonas poae]|nr:phosphotransferase [Pseudomonas poae]
MSLAILIHRANLPNPRISMQCALEVLEVYYDLSGTLHSLGSQQDLSYRLDTGKQRYVLKICRGDCAVLELQAQNEALKHLVRHPNLHTPRVIPAASGGELLSLNIAGQFIHVRVLEFIEGCSLADLQHIDSEAAAELGRFCGQMSLALATFQHQGLERTLWSGPRHASAVISELLPIVADASLRARIADAAQKADQRLQALIETLPMQAIHSDITEDNVLWRRNAHFNWQVQGVIDFGSLVHGWRITDLSVTCASLLQYAKGDPLYILATIKAFHAVNPLSHAELLALWPLVIARTALLLVLGSKQQISVDPDILHSCDNLEIELEVFRVATSVSFELMGAAIFTAVRESFPASACEDFAPLVLDSGVLSPHF